MDIRQIKDLMTAMGRSGTKKLSLKTQSYELHLEREGEPVYRVYPSEQDVEAVAAQPYRHPIDKSQVKTRPDIPPSLTSPVTGHEEGKKTENGLFIKSPMVGTYYSSPSPEDPPFVKVGDLVDKDTVVCIVEAMKVMNEVKAGLSGTVQEALIESGHPVEFGTKLFRIV